MRFHLAIAATLALGFAPPAPSAAQTGTVLTRDSFPIGDSDGILCQVQDRSIAHPARSSIFDRRWAVVCRDNPRPVAEILAFQRFDEKAREAAELTRPFSVTCPAEAVMGTGPVAGSRKRLCNVDGTALRWSEITANARGLTFFAAGFAAYDDATSLALRSIIEDARAPGTIDVASTSVSDPLSFARVQAETLKPEQALAEGYRRNLAGEFAEAAAYFETLQQRLENDANTAINPGEFFVNRALQRSNLGDFQIAERLFAEARKAGGDDPITARLLRNYEAIHLLNQGFDQAAIDRLSEELPESAIGAGELDGALVITAPISGRLNRGQEASYLFGVDDELRLTIEERAQIIDAQALQIRGTARRINGDLDGAREDLVSAFAQAIEVRDGRVTSITRLRSQVLADLALISEARGNNRDAEAFLRNGLALVRAQYPERRAVSALEARLASFLLRQGREDEALALYRSVVDRAIGKRNAVVGFANQLSPYYRLLAERVESDPAAADAFFQASQVLIRPGVAETQEVLARRLSANSDEASRLFRQSVALGREIERARIRFEALAAAQDSPQAPQRQSELAEQIEALELAQLQTQLKLNDYPQYRAVAPSSIGLPTFREALQPGEVYTRIAVVSDDVYVFYADRMNAKAYRVDVSAEQLDAQVNTIRDSISILEGGQYLTFPFDIAAARQLYKSLFGPIASELASATHVIFEPDGAMLRLPIDLLVLDDRSVALYEERIARPDGDEYDFTGVNWLGRGRMVSTAVSAEAFVQMRNSADSLAQRQYAGFGQNAPIGPDFPASFSVSEVSRLGGCFWPVSQWNAPISASELNTIAGLIGSGQSEVVTQAQFTDASIKRRADLDNFKVLHFATHGLVTPPEPNCPARPALVTSFGEAGSDGLLSFEEIFELKLDADLVILSACDTAGAASVEVTRAAGVASGGGTALEGLVRAFVGAGGRNVMASHWPAPDDFDATERLISEMFRLGRDRTIGAALARSRRQLMDDAETSHPFYWAGFAVIGDAGRPLLATPSPALARAAPIGEAD